MGLLIILYPIAEIVAWISFIQNFSFLDGVLWCFLSAAVGIMILRLQGNAAFQELQRASSEGRLPSRQITHQLLMSFGGILLILPGLLTDVIGALLILPGTRHLFVWLIYQRTGGMISKGMSGFAKSGPFGSFVFTAQNFGGAPGASRGQPRDVTPHQDVIDVQATVLQDSIVKPGDQK